ncbi:MAG: CRTAC1 family protein [Phycisphaerales bacterium]
MIRSTAKTWSDVGATIALLIAVCIIAQGCERSKPPPSSLSQPPPTDGAPWFEEVAQQSGLVFEWRSGFRGRHYMPEITGGGAALFDMDGDGDLDAYLVQAGSLVEPNESQPPNLLFRNVGDGAFENVTDGSGADDRGYGMGVACGDYDNDGDVDLYVTNVGPNVLLRNEGDGRFTDVTGQAGVGHPGWGSSAAFVDYDHDGDLDLYVCNYLNWSVATEIDCFNEMGVSDYCGPKNYNAPAMDVLYRNNGEGTFTDVSELAGLNQALGTGLGVVCGDFNNDGWIDIFVANDLMPDHLWLNQGNGTFRDEALFAGCAIDQEGKAKAGMGVTAADIDDDGDLDLMVCNLNNESDSLFRNEGGYFTDSTAMMGLGAVSRPFTRFGMAWTDFDNDGYLDLYQANGRVMRQSRLFSDNPFAEPNLLFRGHPTGRFQEVRPRGGTRELLTAASRAAAFGDIDQDGAVDVLVVNRDGKAHLLHNIVANRGNWINFRVIEEHGRDALGATVRLTLGNRRITRDVRAAYSFLASNDPKVHVGLGKHDVVTDVSVRWIDGGIESFGDFGANQVVTLHRGDG